MTKPFTDDPDFADKQRFFDKVVSTMVHSPCEGTSQRRTAQIKLLSTGNPNAYCHERPPNKRNVAHSRCTKNFPEPFAPFTSITDGKRVRPPSLVILCSSFTHNVHRYSTNGRTTGPHA